MRLLCIALALAASAAGASPADRFVTRSYFTGGREVVVGVRSDLIALRVPGATPDQVALIVERVASEKLADAVQVRRAWRLRDHGLFAVELAPLERPTMVALATALEDEGLRTWPALARSTGRAFYDDRIVVTAKPGKLDAVLAEVRAKTNGALIRKSRIPDTALMEVGNDHDAVNASRALSGMKDVVSIEPDLYRELQHKALTNDPVFPDQWHLSRQNDDVPGEGEIFADDAWDTTFGDPAVVIAVFDSGIDVDHPDLAANIVGGFDANAGDEDPRPTCSQSPDGRDVARSCPDEAPFRESHGTSVSGVIGAVGNNERGVTGVCPLCSIMPVRLLGDQAGTGLSIGEAFFRAVDDGAHAINNSWGPGFSLFFPLSQAERDAFKHARDNGRGGKGTVILFAAGNSTADVARDAYASDPYTIAVAATTNLDDWAPYSNYGAQIDIAAPSQGLTADQDGIPDDDFGIITTDVSGDDGYSDDDINPGFSGTSAASPVAAGVVGLILSTNPDLTAAQVRLVLAQSADKIVADKMPWEELIREDIEAIFAYDDTGHSIGFGYGRVNAARAVELAATFGVAGGPCSAPGCTFCSADNVCLERCASQLDCGDGSVCDPAIGACELPRDIPADVLSPCSADCPVCTPTLDTEFQTIDICTTTCNVDDDCPDAFDCRLTEPGGISVCGVGDRGAGGPNDFFGCFSPSIGTAIVVVTDSGRELCGDVCFDDGPGACPYGFTCGLADCECVAGGQFGCFQFNCVADDEPNNFDGDDFFFPVCLVNPGHADVCDSDLDCQLGDYCFKEGNSGTCRLDDRAGCDICKRCETSDECVGRGICIGTQDDGIGECVWACEDSDPCPGDSQCRTIEGRFGELQVCLSPEGGSSAEDRCDRDYSCSVACRDDVPCAAGQICEGGTCVDAPPDDEFPNVGGGGCPGCSASSGPQALLLGAFALLLRGRPWRARRH